MPAPLAHKSKSKSPSAVGIGLGIVILILFTLYAGLVLTWKRPQSNGYVPKRVSEHTPRPRPPPEDDDAPKVRPAKHQQYDEGHQQQIRPREPPFRNPSSGKKGTTTEKPVIPKRNNDQGIPTPHTAKPKGQNAHSQRKPKCDASGKPLEAKTRLEKSFQLHPGTEKFLNRLQENMRVRVMDSDNAFPSYSMFSFRYLPHVLIVSPNGKVMASYSFPYLTTVVAPKFVNSTTISGIFKKYSHKPAGPMDLTRPLLINWETRVEERAAFTEKFLHHDIEYNPITEKWILLQRSFDKKNTALMDSIYQAKRNGDIIWKWDSRTEMPFDGSVWTHVGKHPSSDCVDFRIGYCKDWMHGNTVHWDSTQGVVYYNAKHQDSFFKLNVETRKIEWAVGRKGGFKLFDIYGRQKQALFYKAHGIERIGDNHFLIFDNDYQNNTRQEVGNSPHHPGKRQIWSRALEIKVDPVKKEAREVWVWKGSKGRFAFQMGDADRLPNGNTVASFTNTDFVQESNREGKVVWEMSFPRLGSNDFYIYHYERFMLRPLVTLNLVKADGRRRKENEWLENKPGALIHAEEITVKAPEGRDLEVPLLAWNTVRVRYAALGQLVAFIDGKAVHQQEFRFEPNWIPTSLQATLPEDSVSCGGDVRVVFELSNADDIVGCRYAKVHRACR